MENCVYVLIQKYIKREIFPILRNNDIIRLSGEKIFSVINMKDRFWQLELNEKSSNLCIHTIALVYSFNYLYFLSILLIVDFEIKSQPAVGIQCESQ